MIVGRIPVFDDDVPTLTKARALFAFLAESADAFQHEVDVLDEILQRIRECDGDLGAAHARAFAQRAGIDTTANHLRSVS